MRSAGDPSRTWLDRMRSFWLRGDRMPWSPPAKSLAESTLAVVCSNAYMTEPGHRIGSGEHASRFRVIGDEARREETDEASAGLDDAVHREDRQLMPVLDCARTLVQSGRVGRLSAHPLQLSGAVVTHSELIEETRRAAVPRLVGDNVDVVLLVPT